MSKVDKNDIIYFKQACDKTYTTSKNADGNGLVQQMVDGVNVYPKTISEAVVMSDGKTLDEVMQSGGTSNIARVNDVAISGNTSITSTGSYQFGVSFSPSNYNVEIESVTVVSDCSEITISNVTVAGFTMNVNAIPAATDHKLTITVKDKIGTALTKEVAFTMRQSATSMSVSGQDTLDATSGSVSANYTVAYSPTGFNVPVQSLEVVSDNTQIVVSDVSVNGFKLTATATQGYEANITLTATTEQGVITLTKKITVTYIQKIKSVTIGGQTEFTGTGSAYYTLTLLPANHNIPISKVEVTTTDSKLVASNATQAGFTLNVNGIPTSTSHTLTAKITDSNGNIATGTLDIAVKQEPTSLSISGSSSLDNGVSSNYTISYSPSTYNVAPSSVEITANSSSVTISNKTKTGFTFKPNLSSSASVIITVKATMPSGKVITNTKSVAVNCGPDYDAIDEYGAAIMDTKGRFYQTVAEWQAAGRPSVNGVAVSNGTNRFCIAPYHVESVCGVSGYSGTDYWGAYNKKVSGIITTTDYDTAKADFNGVANTDAIVANVTLSDGHFNQSPWSAAGLCRQYIFPNGASGYLGALGEWNLVNSVINKVNTLMDAIGERIETTPTALPYYWSSTQCDYTYAWYWDFGYNRPSGTYKTYSYRVRPFCSF